LKPSFRERGRQNFKEKNIAATAAAPPSIHLFHFTTKQNNNTTIP
jgi:hypothetical protein